MKPPREKQAAPEIIGLLAGLFSSSPMAIEVQEVGSTNRYNYMISVAGHRFMAEYKSNASAGSVAVAIDCLKRSSETMTDAGLPLIVVPFMGEVGRQLCDQSPISWLALCGNAKIVT